MPSILKAASKLSKRYIPEYSKVLDYAINNKDMAKSASLVKDFLSLEPKGSVEDAISKLKELATTPERKAVLRDDIVNYLRKKLSDESVDRASLMGSFASKKPNPGDIDIVVRRNFDKIKKDSKLRPPKGLHFIEEVYNAPLFHRLNTMKSPMGFGATNIVRHTMDMEKVGRERYGDRYRWIKLLGLGSAFGTGAWVDQEKNSTPR